MPITESRFNAASFQFCPICLFAVVGMDWLQVQEVYREAYERAKVDLRPTILDQLRPTWN